MLGGSNTARPQLLSQERVLEFGGLRPLSETEKTRLSAVMGTDVADVSDQVLVRIVGEPVDGWFPNFADVIEFITSEIPGPHKKTFLQEWFQGAGRSNDTVAAGSVRMRNPTTGNEGVFLALYPYHKPEWNS